MQQMPLSQPANPHFGSWLLGVAILLLVISVILFASALNVPSDRTDLPQLIGSEIALLGAGVVAWYADRGHWDGFQPGNRRLLLAAFGISNLSAGLFLVLVGVGVLNLIVAAALLWRAAGRGHPR